MNLAQLDSSLIWHPFSKAKLSDMPIVIKSGKGSYLYDEDGKKYIDLISSWWVNLHGHSHPQIAEAISHQARELEHVIFADFTHKPAIEICDLIRKEINGDLTRFFFSDNGSTAVEVALKMAYQYWVNKGEGKRKLFLSFSGGYHGDTIGAMSLGGGSGFHDIFKKLLFDVLFMPYPETWEGDENVWQKENDAIEKLQQYLLDYKGQISALIIEPLIQGAGGMRICRKEFIQKVIKMIQEQDILVIFDEVMTGFGRTGSTFALQQIGITPDFLCLSKGLTGGFLPLALTITTDAIYEEFLVDQHLRYSFSHGHSYTANPIACSAAIASWNLLMTLETQEKLQAIHVQHQKEIKDLKKHCKNIVKTRVVGTISAFDILMKNNDKTSIQKIRQNLLSKGLLMRPLGNTFYLIPPYSITPEELNEVYQIIANEISRQ